MNECGREDEEIGSEFVTDTERVNATSNNNIEQMQWPYSIRMYDSLCCWTKRLNQIKWKKRNTIQCIAGALWAFLVVNCGYPISITTYILSRVYYIELCLLSHVSYVSHRHVAPLTLRLHESKKKRKKGETEQPRHKAREKQQQQRNDTTYFVLSVIDMNMYIYLID